MEAKQYDYIFLGAGCASLSIIMRMIASEKFKEKKILLVEKEAKIKNDRTWCFWEKSSGFFENIVYHKWNKLLLNSDNETIPLQTGDYQYKMIRGIDFYRYCFTAIQHQNNIDIVYGEVSFEKNSRRQVKLDDEYLSLSNAAIIFNSLYQPSKKQKGKFYLLQHFKGWVIETSGDYFNSDIATLMDFRVSQDNGTSFGYVLPLSPSKCLVEFTIFSENLLPKEEYDKALKNYLSGIMQLTNYSIVEEEFGVIPMTNESFYFYKDGMYNIGTAGGQTKASTGYTFNFIQKQADKIVEDLILNGIPPGNNSEKKRFHFYDSTLLHILSKKLLEGKRIFTLLFKKNSADLVFKFLDNETTFAEEIKLLNTLPKKVFIKAGFSEFIKMAIPKKDSINN
jgi:lycopene beta-cyclase